MTQMNIQPIESNPQSDSMYVYFSDKPISFSVELSPDVILDIDKENNVVGIDFQHVTTLMRGSNTSTTPLELAVRWAKRDM